MTGIIRIRSQDSVVWFLMPFCGHIFTYRNVNDNV